MNRRTGAALPPPRPRPETPMRRPSDLLFELQPLLIAAAAAVIVALSYIVE